MLSTECEMCFVHVCLSTVPEDLPYEQLISDAHELFQLYPPSELADEAEFEYENRFGFYRDIVRVALTKNLDSEFCNF